MEQFKKGAELWAQTLGKNLWYHRKVRRMTLKETAASLHISPRTLSRLEHGIIGKAMSVAVVLDAARLFHVRIAELFGAAGDGAGDS